MKKTKKLLLAILVVCSVLTCCSFTAFAGYDNDIVYAITMADHQKNAYSDDGYTRDTTNPKEAWKVQMVLSAEGKKTYAYYFLASDNILRTRYSNEKLVQQGDTARYYSAYDSAAGKDIALGCRNNNDVNKTYIVSGYWDEETGITARDD